MIAMCQFNSIHRKEFRFLVSGLDPLRLTRKCRGGHVHVRIEGASARESAIYTIEMARHVAAEFSRSLRAQRDEEAGEAERAGKESVLVNDVLMTGGWSVVRQWFWRGKSHINILETSVFVSVLKEAVVSKPGHRLAGILDSGVAIGSLSKGRSSSFSLQPCLKKGAALQIAGNLYPGLSFGPTRLNIADDPSRGASLRQPSMMSIAGFLQPEELHLVSEARTTRFLAGWIRLTFLIVVWTSCHQGAAASPAFASDIPLNWPHVCFACLIPLAAFVLFCLSDPLSSRVFRPVRLVLAMACFGSAGAVLFRRRLLRTRGLIDGPISCRLLTGFLDRRRGRTEKSYCFNSDNGLRLKEATGIYSLGGSL